MVRGLLCHCPSVFQLLSSAPLPPPPARFSDQKKARSKMCCLLMFGTVALAVLILVVLSTHKKDPAYGNSDIVLGYFFSHVFFSSALHPHAV